MLLNLEQGKESFLKEYFSDRVIVKDGLHHSDEYFILKNKFAHFLGFFRTLCRPTAKWLSFSL